MVIRLRHELGAKKLRKLDGRSLLVHGINKGWVGKGGAGRVQLGAIKVKGKMATAEPKGAPPGAVVFGFVKEKGRWRLDLVSLLAASNQAMKGLIARMKRSEDEFILKTVEMVSGKKVPASIWKPLSK